MSMHNPYEPILPPANCLCQSQQCLAPVMAPVMAPAIHPIEENGPTNLYVSNLPHKVTDDWVRTEFGVFGLITSAKVMMDHGKHKGYGFVQFMDPHCARAAVDGMNGRCYGENVLNVKFADHDKDKGIANRPSNNVYIGNLPLSFGVNDLMALFDMHGPVSSLVVLTDPYSGNSRGVGLVRFYTLEDAAYAVSVMNGVLLPGHDRPLEVKFAESSDEKSARRFTKSGPQRGQGTGGNARSRGSGKTVNSMRHQIPTRNEEEFGSNHSDDSPGTDGSAASPSEPGMLSQTITRESWDSAFNDSDKNEGDQSPQTKLPPPEKGATVNVLGLPTGFAEVLLYKLFSPFGAVVSAKVAEDSEASPPAAAGLVQFRRLSEAQNAAKQLNGFPLLKRKLIVSLQVAEHAVRSAEPFCVPPSSQHRL